VTERRALLTDREREIVAGDADVEDPYRYQTISRVRARFDRLERDLEALEKHGDLADELRDRVCRAEGGQDRRDTSLEEPSGESPFDDTPRREEPHTPVSRPAVADVVDEIAEVQDPEELREFVERAEAGEFGADPGVEATVRIVRAILDEDTDP
jgi:hypothetical protein